MLGIKDFDRLESQGEFCSKIDFTGNSFFFLFFKNIFSFYQIYKFKKILVAHKRTNNLYELASLSNTKIYAFQESEVRFARILLTNALRRILANQPNVNFPHEDLDKESQMICKRSCWRFRWAISTPQMMAYRRVDTHKPSPKTPTKTELYIDNIDVFHFHRQNPLNSRLSLLRCGVVWRWQL